MSFDVNAFAIILVLLTVIYTAISELATKSMDIFLRNSIFTYPIASVVVYVLNYFSPKYYYTSQDPYGLTFTSYLYFAFMVLSVFSAYAGTIIARLVSGFEASCEKPVVVSYSIEGKIGDVHALRRDFLKSINVETTNVMSGTHNYVKFYHGSNQYFSFSDSVENDCVEINFVVLRWKKETIVEPNKDDLNILLGYFQSFLNNQKEKGKLGKWTSDFKPQHADTMETYIWKYYTSPLQLKEKIALKGLVSQRIVNFLKSHKKGIIAFIMGILAVVIGQLIIRYLIQVLGI